MSQESKQWPEGLVQRVLVHIYILCAVPGVVALWLSFSSDETGARVLETLVQGLAAACLFMLAATLSVTPLARILKQPNLAMIRRPLGLAAFAYAFLHWAAIFFLYDFNGTAIAFAFRMNPALWAALIALILMVPMMLTANHQAMHRLGVWWRRIHSAIYVVAILWIYYMATSFRVGLGEQLLFSLVALLIVSRFYRMYAVQSKQAQYYEYLNKKRKDDEEDGRS